MPRNGAGRRLLPRPVKIAPPLSSSNGPQGGMQPRPPIWTQRLPPDVRRRLELAVAAAAEARSDTHAQQALNLVAVLASRKPSDEAGERYLDEMGLAGEEAETLRNRPRAAHSASGLAAD